MLVFPFIYGDGYYFSTNGLFRYPSLVVIPNYVTALTDYTEQAFYKHSEIEQIIFEKDSPITLLPYYCFGYCTSLQSIDLPKSLTEIGRNCFYSCTSLQSIDLPKSLTKLNESCFQYCSSLDNIVIPEGIAEIPKNCFYGCSNLTNLEIPETVKTFSEGCFWNCHSLTDDFVEKYFVNRDNTLSANIFQGCDGLRKVTVDFLGRAMFSDCQNLQEVTILKSRSDKETGYASLSRCPSLKTVIFKDNEKTTTVSDYFCLQCTSLQTIDLPDSITSMGSYCFQDCTSLQTIDLPDSITSMGSYCFQDCTSLQTIDLPDSITEIPSYCFNGCSSLREIIIPDGVTAIKSYAFLKTGLQTITLGEKVKTVGYRSFADNAHLTSVIFPQDSLTTLDYGAFQNNIALEEITLPNSITSVGSSTFSDCTSLREVNLPQNENFKSLPSRIFLNCTSLKEIQLPDNITTIDNYAFQKSGVEKIYIGSKISSISNYAFYSTPSLTDVYIDKKKGDLTIPSNKWSANSSVVFHWQTSSIKFVSDVDLTLAKLYINGEKNSDWSYETEDAKTIQYKVYHPDYLPIESSVECNPPEVREIQLPFSTASESGEKGVRLKVISANVDASVVVEYDNIYFNTDSVLVKSGTQVSYWAETADTVSQIYSIVVTEDTEVSIPNTGFSTRN